jgi:phosphate:Na+ symporter
MAFAGVALEAITGLGLFLLGLNLMTDGLKAMAGDSMRRALMRFTRNRLSAIGAGIIGTVILQSSSATIIATVGFVGAGLLTFNQSLGIIFGATLGTTFTGWIIALLGFKLKLGAVAAIFIFIGALLRLFGGEKRTGLAFSLAGFGLIFIGIVALQQGLHGLQDHIDFSHMAADSLWGKFQLAIIGVGITLITQSSLVGVVATLASLHTGAIQLEQALALVVGMNVGTTFTAAVATIGGNVHVRRTGFSHVVYSAFVSTLALFLITPYLMLWQWFASEGGYEQSELGLVLFHSGFNLVGLILIYPVIPQFARLIERLFPERPSSQSGLLDKGLLPFPEVALTAVQKALQRMQQQALTQLHYLLGVIPRPSPLVELEASLRELEDYLDAIHLPGTTGVQWDRLLAALHWVDHLERLRERCEDESVQITLRTGEGLSELREALLGLIAASQAHDLTAEDWDQRLAAISTTEDNLRQSCLQQIALGRLELKQGVALMDAARWLQHVAVHLARIEAANRQLNYEPKRSTEIQ